MKLIVSGGLGAAQSEEREIGAAPIPHVGTEIRVNGRVGVVASVFINYDDSEVVITLRDGWLL